jgi:hypothetical protein
MRRVPEGRHIPAQASPFQDRVLTQTLKSGFPDPSWTVLLGMSHRRFTGLMFRGRQPLLDECMACYRQLRPNFRCRRSILTYHFSVCSVSIN